MKLFLLKFPLLLSFIVAACGNSDPAFVGDSSMAKMEIAAPVAEYEEETNDFSQRKIIRDGTINFKCQDIQETDAFLRNEVTALKGYISNESSNSYGERTERSLTIRVPFEQFDGLIAKIQSHAVKVDFININSEDVTEQFIDIEARLKIKKELETRYSELLKQTKSIDEILSLERELSNVRGEIESMEGRLKYLENKTTLSTLQVTFYVEQAADFGFLGKAKDALVNGWSNLQWFFIILLNLWPFFLIGAILVGIILFKKKRSPPKL